MPEIISLKNDETKKALECCVKGCSKDCPLYFTPVGVTCGKILHKNTFDFIKKTTSELAEKDEMLKAQADTIFLYEHVIKDKNEEIEKLRSLCSAKDVIINSQETDNEKLKTQLYLEKYTDIAKRNIKFEVIKELEQKLKVHAYYIDFPKRHRVVDEDDIALVAKEITEVEI